MTKQWEKPILKMLDVAETMAGPGIKTPDAEQTDPDESVNYS
jgi:hypothetical protein